MCGFNPKELFFSTFFEELFAPSFVLLDAEQYLSPFPITEQKGPAPLLLI